MQTNKISLLAVAGVTAVMGLGLFRSAPTETRASSADKGGDKLRRMEERITSLEKKVDELSRNLQLVTANFQDRIKRMEQRMAISRSAPGTGNKTSGSESSGGSTRKKKQSAELSRMYEPAEQQAARGRRGLSYENLRGAVRSASDKGKEELQEAVMGVRVYWSGWVKSTEDVGGKKKVTVAMFQDQETYPSAKVVFTLPPGSGDSLASGQRIWFTGKIESIEPRFGSVRLTDTRITRRTVK